MSDLLVQAVKNAELEAWREAKKLTCDLTSSADVVLKARLRTIERTLAVLVAAVTPPTVGAVTDYERTLAALKDYWEEVAGDIRGET